MIYYELGNPHHIAAMASKSCNAVGKRDLYVPLGVDYEVNGREYTITLSLYCFFQTRININNTFSDIVLGGNNIPNTTVDGWVKKEIPGKQVAQTTITGHFNADGTPDIKHRTLTVSGNMLYYADVACQTRKSIPFYNEVALTIEDIEPAYTTPATPTASLSLATDNRLVISLETTSFGEGGGKFLYAELSKTNFGRVVRTSDVLNILAGDVFAVNLQRNTKYYVKAIAANNGMSASAVPIEAVTLAASEIIGIEPISGGARVNTIIYSGGGYYQPNTSIEMSTDLTNWESKASTTSRTTFVTEINGLDAGTTYYFRTKTETDAGVFYSNHVSFMSPGDIYGYITSIEPGSDTAVVNYTAFVEGDESIDAIFYYRIVGLEEEWVECAQKTILPGENASFTLNGLQPNYYNYEISANFRQGMKEYDADPVSFYTIPEAISNDNCDSLEYLAQLICQELEEIKNGNITIFMNDDTKKWCEDETDDTPTLASMMSRINRFMHAVGCTLCSMDGFIELMKDSKENQIFMGKLGWVDIEDEVIDGSLSPVMSSAIYAAVDDLVHKVWHYFGAYDYYGIDLADLQDQQGEDGDTGVVGDKVYTWANNAWGNPQDINPENFGVIHINSGKYEGQGYYWFVDGWNRLDLDDKDIQARLEALEQFDIVTNYDGEDYKIAIVDSEMTDEEINIEVPTDVTRDTVILVTENITPKIYGGLKFTGSQPEGYAPAILSYSIEGDISVDLKYSMDNGKTWTEWLPDYPLVVSNDEVVCVKGNNPNGMAVSSNEYTQFVMDGNISASGNINSLLDDGDGSSVTELTAYCYCSLFRDCSSLITAPELPATTLASVCYYRMFYNCSSLTTAPELPATTLASDCYSYLFYNCSSLTTAPELPATTLALHCYEHMFRSCSSLTTAPNFLPATTLPSGCYNSMFYQCTSLTTAPIISALTQESFNCCYAMFYGCSSLNVSPYPGSSGVGFFHCSTSQTTNVEDMFKGTQGSAPDTPAAGKSYFYIVS